MHGRAEASQDRDDPVLQCSGLFAGCLQFHEEHSAAWKKNDPIRHAGHGRAGPLDGQASGFTRSIDKPLFDLALKHCAASAPVALRAPAG